MLYSGQRDFDNGCATVPCRVRLQPEAIANFFLTVRICQGTIEWVSDTIC